MVSSVVNKNWPRNFGRLVSLILHDMAGPVGATGNGLDLARETKSAEALELAVSSARSAAQRLDFHRLAFGLASDAMIETGMLLRAFQGQFHDSGHDIQFQAKHDFTRQDGQTIALIAWLLARQLPRGGQIILEETVADQQRIWRVIGRGGKISPNLRLQELTSAPLTLESVHESADLVASLLGQILRNSKATTIWGDERDADGQVLAVFVSVTVALND